jgi:glycosyltransferase involved in cell wall biosynthesis
MSDARPLVSIVTPSLNQGRYVEAAIESVLAQDYSPIEHIVVDGGSTDETLDVLRRHTHLRWASEPDDGQAHAIDKGFRLASGSIFAWLNADDIYLPGAVSAAVAALRETGAALVHGAWRQLDEHGATLRDVPVVPFDLRRQLDVANRVSQPTTFFTREAYFAVGGVDPRYRYAMDYELWLKLGTRFDVREIDATLAAHRFHAASKTVAEPFGFFDETRRASRRHGGRFFSPLYLDWYLPRRRPWAYRALLAARDLRAGDLRGLGRRIAARARRS